MKFGLLPSSGGFHSVSFAVHEFLPPVNVMHNTPIKILELDKCALEHSTEAFIKTSRWGERYYQCFEYVHLRKPE